jgi:hypothetical protein
MDHFWKTFQEGYFTFPDYYSWVALELSKLGRSVHLVEVGVFTGQSAAYMGVELMNLGVDAKLDLVDVFTDGGTATDVMKRLLPVLPVIGQAWTCLSWEGAKNYEDGSLDFVFIDASHVLEDVARDIDAWLPKVKKGGLIAGHDFCAYPGFGVMRAVLERFPRFEIFGGITTGGNEPMQGRYWPVWSVRV